MPPDSEGETSDATSAVDTVIDAGEKVDQNISEVDSLSITKSVGGGGQTTEINSAIHETSPQDESDTFTKEALEEEKTNQEIPNQTTTMKDEEIIETTISVPVLNNTKQQQSSNPTEVIQIQVQPKNSNGIIDQEADNIEQPIIIPDKKSSDVREDRQEVITKNDENMKKLKDDLRKSLKKPASSVPEIPGAIEPAIEGSDSQDENEEVENHEPPEKGKSKKPKSKSSCCTII